MKITEEDVILMSKFLVADASTDEFVAHYGDRVEIIVRIMEILNEVIDSGKIPGWFKDAEVESIKHVEMKKMGILEDLDLGSEFGVRLKHRVPKLYEQLVDPSTRVFDTSQAIDYVPHLFDVNREEILVGSKIEYTDSHASKRGTVENIQEALFSDSQDHARIDVLFEGEKYEEFFLVLWNEPIDELRVLRVKSKPHEIFEAIVLLKDMRKIKRATEKQLDREKVQEACIAKFKGATVTEAAPFVGRMGRGFRVIIEKNGELHSIDFIKGISGKDHGAMVYKDICEYPFLPVIQGETLRKTAMKTIKAWGILDPKNLFGP